MGNFFFLSCLHLAISSGLLPWQESLYSSTGRRDLHLDYLVVEAGEVLVHDVLLQDVLQGEWRRGEVEVRRAGVRGKRNDQENENKNEIGIGIGIGIRIRIRILPGEQ